MASDRTPIQVPELPESVADATVIALHKKAGDAVKRDELIAELETDKVVLEVSAPSAGTLVELSASEGDVVKADAVLGYLGPAEAASEDAEDEAGDEPARAKSADQASPAESTPAAHDQEEGAAAQPAESEASGAAASDATSVPPPSPSVRRLLQEAGLSPEDVEGTGEDAIRCRECGANASAFGFEYGFTVAFDDDRTVGVTMDDDAAHGLATDAEAVMDIPENSRQHPIVLYEPAGMPGTVGRLRPFVGTVGTTPSIELPDSHNAGDFGQALIGADHDWGLEDEDELARRTDGHMDVPEVREGAILICPVKVEGAGIYVGDLHANQGDGELALHTTDVSGTVRMEVEVIEGLDVDGPLLLPNPEDLPHVSAPYADEELEAARAIAADRSVNLVEDAGPIQIIGTGATINDATQNAFDRGCDLFGMSEGELRNRCTFTGGVSIGRLPGVVQLHLRAPIDVLEERGIAHLVREQYGL